MKLFSVLTILFSLSLYGCGGGPADAVPLGPIEGVVNLDGKPIKNPVVTFYPEAGPTGVGVGNENGEFKIKTNGANGAPIGKCKVTVVAANEAGAIPEMDGNESAIAKTATLNIKYANKETTDLVVEVTEAGNTSLKLDLDSQ